MIGACWFSPWYPLTPTDRVFAAPHRDSGPCDRRSTEEVHDSLETINSNRKPLEADSSCATCLWLVAILLFVYRICCSFYGRFGKVPPPSFMEISSINPFMAVCSPPSTLLTVAGGERRVSVRSIQHSASLSQELLQPDNGIQVADLHC